MKQQHLFPQELAREPVGRRDRRIVLKPRRRPKRHLDGSIAFSARHDAPVALCWAMSRGNLGYEGAHDKNRIVTRLKAVSCKWCLQGLRDEAQLQSFYVLREVDNGKEK